MAEVISGRTMESVTVWASSAACAEVTAERSTPPIRNSAAARMASGMEARVCSREPAKASGEPASRMALVTASVMRPAKNIS